MLHIKKIKPRYTKLITTADRFEEDYTQKGIVISAKGVIKPWQTVIAVGSVVKDIIPGDKVMINYDAYRKKKIDPNSIKNEMTVDNPVVEEHLPYIEMDDKKGNTKEYLLLEERDIMFPFEGEERKETTLIMPKKKKIII